MRTRWMIGPVVLASLLLGVMLACSPSDPRVRILEERARWQVELVGWTATEDGSIRITLRASGPVKSSLETLTVRLDFVDASEKTTHTHWESLDVAKIQRGTPTDFRVVLESLPEPPEGIAVDMVLEPSPEDEPYIVELGTALAGS